jgi:hypothetical protein
MGTLKKSIGQQFNAPTLFAADTLANLSRPQANEKAKTTPATYGLGLENVLAFLDPVTQYWKMYKGTCLLAELPSLEKLPSSGMTQNGVLYRQKAWARLTDETACLLWPTPVASDWKPRGPNSKHQGVWEVVRTRSNLWPTPTTVDTFTPKSRSNPTLGDAARKADGNNGKLNPTWIEWLMGFPLGWTDLED